LKFAYLYILNLSYLDIEPPSSLARNRTQQHESKYDQKKNSNYLHFFLFKSSASKNAESFP